MSKEKKPHTDLGTEDKDCLIELYNKHATASVDELPYTEAIERIHQEFNHSRNRALTEGDIHKALKNLGRQGKLGGKFSGG